MTGLQAVFGYIDTSLETFTKAKQMGLRTIYEMPTPYWKSVRELTDTESQRWPDWAEGLPKIEPDSEQSSRRDQELQLADLVIVPSTFVRDSLFAAPAFKAPIAVVPYGCPKSIPQIRNPKSEIRNPLKLLFAGTLSQSKGLADLLEAIQPLGNQVHLSIAGSPSSSDVSTLLHSALRTPHSAITLLGQLPHARLLEEMHHHDVFVLPTLYEGLALVLLEAMSRGLPVITTENSGIADLIENGKQGIVLPIRRPDLIRDQLDRMISDPTVLQSMGSAAFEWSRMNSWADYRQNLKEALHPVLGMAS
mgnify:CR=1 FL=1